MFHHHTSNRPRIYSDESNAFLREGDFRKKVATAILVSIIDAKVSVVINIVGDFARDKDTLRFLQRLAISNLSKA